MVKEKKKLLLYIIPIVIILLAAIVLIIVHSRRAKPDTVPAPVVSTAPEIIVQEKPVEHVITADIIRDGLRDMGFLVTQEYYFTEVVSNSRVRTLFGITLPFTESSYVVSYDGTVAAGVDLSDVTVEKDEINGVITVHLPAAEISQVNIDPASFKLYDEKNGLGTSISVADYNASLVEAESSARTKALEKGLTEKAAANAQTIIGNFINSLMDKNTYTIRILSPGGE